MRIIQINLYQVSIPFRFSFTHANAQRKQADNIIIEVRTEKGAVGYGEAIAREYLTGETLDSIWTDITEFWMPKIMDIEFSFSKPIHEQLLPLYKEASKLRKLASYGALDIAIHDAAALTRGLRIPELLGFPQATPRLTAPLGGSTEKSIKKKAILFKFLMFKDFKVKTGLGNDLEKVSIARKIIGKKASLRVDTNQGWSFEEAVRIIPELQNLGVDIFEEPVKSVEEMAILNKTLSVDIMADESLCSYEDAERLVELGAASVWNVRLGKNGGFTGVIELIKLAEKNNIKLHLGVLVGETAALSEASLAISGITDFIHVEYGFSKILLKKEPFFNGTGGYFGKAKVSPKKAGLGLAFYKKSLKKYIRREASLNNGVYTEPKPVQRSILTDMSIFRR